ncbi:DUF3372 domain-containing protein [Paucibacter sp. B2R-40]|uniref:alpha-1,6-glucosidase domain-containing protein n=1 Tax=Paucibacter sp. B2R-40 TaxID=2893554 RepID=UPI0021E41E81|nr:alpha-1,6-glucosidase domain-containing protein [Paucibacter sp. B2R-40]MCV2353624.1 DUF3372 domain-containing protein [Paucibacter sp. B2R-40]
MTIQWSRMLRETRRVVAQLSLGLAAALALGQLSACGGGAAPDSNAATLEAGRATGLSVDADSSDSTVLAAVPLPPDARRKAAAAVSTSTLRVHYRRANGDTAGWQLHSWGAAQSPNWNEGWNATGSDDFGAIYDVPLAANAGEGGSVGYLLHKGDWKDWGGADQSYTLKPGANEIWRLEGDASTYASNPLGLPVPDIKTLRVHYKRFDSAYASWGLHLWNGSGLNAAALPAGMVIDQWGSPVALSAMPGYAAGAGEVVFDIPVLNPQLGGGQTALEFIIHGMAPNQGDKDGRDNNIRVDYASLNIKNQVGEIWLVQQDPDVYQAPPDLRSVSSTDSRAVWLNKSLLQWPRVTADGVVRLYYSAKGQIVVQRDALTQGSDGFITLDAFAGTVPADAALRFKYVAAGAVFKVREADLVRLPFLHTQQLVLVQENAAGLAQNASTTQIAGAMDELYAAAADEANFGAVVAQGRTSFKLWAPTAQAVSLIISSDSAQALTRTESIPMQLDPATGSWSLSLAGDRSGQIYRFAVQVFVRGVGLVRNQVTDPYSLGLSMGSQHSVVTNLQSPALKPAGWDESAPPNTVASSADMSIYELHVRDFSINDSTVPADKRGKYLAFAEAGSKGMKHLGALAQSGLTDVHLLPVFDIASVNEKNCLTPTPSGTPDGETQQAAVAATASSDCFNWGYDPLHFSTPEGSYASSAAKPAARVLEFRSMVQALNAAGLRVGMDMVYNHTSASGQNAASVLDKVVPGYYHRLNAVGGVERSTCCENTAAENHMMAKLMIDSAITWTRDYRISSLRFDIMGHHPRSVMEALKARVKAATGREVQILGEGWNFGEVANGARFVQAEMMSLNGSGIGSFNPFIRDAVRGGSSFDSGNNQFANQGYINGLFYDPNGFGGGKTRGDLMWQGDLIKASLAGSIRSFQLQTSWDANLRLEEINAGGLSAGYVLEPSEVVNYVENHDNTTLFDNNAFKLPSSTSREDRARVQILGAAINSFSQGIAYFHAGVDTLRSKSMDRNSYDSGDWFNKLDWSYADNNFGVGLPPARDNADNWPLVKPLLANPLIKPAAADIAWTRDAFRDLLAIRKSTTLLRLRTAEDIKARLSFHNTGSAQEATVLVGHLNGAGYAGANFQELVYLINVDKSDKQLSVPALAGRNFELHPVHRAPGAADKRAAQAKYEAGTGQFTLPARTAVVFVVQQPLKAKRGG